MGNFCSSLCFQEASRHAAGVPNLAMIETVDDEKIANHLDRAVGNIGRKLLKVLVRVNPSGETPKFGVDPTARLDLVRHGVPEPRVLWVNDDRRIISVYILK